MNMSLDKKTGNVNVNDSTEPRELKRSTAKEELVALTGNLIDAVILNHLIKCQAQSRQIERFIEEERERLKTIGQELGTPPTRGWFYKKASELSEETMVGLAESNIRARLKKLIASGWVMDRNNPFIKWDKTKQYRVDIRKISSDLENIGYTLDGWLISRISETEDRTSKTKDRDFKTKVRENETKVREYGNERAIPSTYITSSSIQGNNIQDVVDDFSTSLNSVFSETEYNDLKSKLSELRVSQDRAAYLIKTYPDRIKQAVHWWNANQEYLNSRNSPGGAVASSIENPEKYPQVYQNESFESKPQPPIDEKAKEQHAECEEFYKSLSQSQKSEFDYELRAQADERAPVGVAWVSSTPAYISLRYELLSCPKTREWLSQNQPAPARGRANMKHLRATANKVLADVQYGTLKIENIAEEVQEFYPYLDDDEAAAVANMVQGMHRN